MENYLNTEVQNRVLNEAKDNGTTVTFIVTNGFQIRGKIIDFDDYTILVNDKSEVKLIYKHALSTLELPKKKSSSNQT